MRKLKKVQIIVLLIYGILSIAGVFIVSFLSKDNFEEATRLTKIYNDTQNISILQAAYTIRYQAILYFFWLISIMLVLSWWLDIYVFKGKIVKNKVNLVLFAFLSTIQAILCYLFALCSSVNHIARFGYVYMLLEFVIITCIAFFIPKYKTNKKDTNRIDNE